MAINGVMKSGVDGGTNLLRQVLDKGFIELVDCLGSDVTVLNAARVSFAKEVCRIGEADEKLINYLAKNKHSSPFYHPQLQFRVKAPISVQRQWFKHKIGTAENSESTRYVHVHDEYYFPEKFRKQSILKKQGSDGYLDEEFDTFVKLNGQHERAPLKAARLYSTACRTAFQCYRELVAMGVAKEQAREVLPLCTYTSWIWTASLFAVHNFIKLRDHDHAQLEIREYAKALKELALEKFPISLAALQTHDAF